MIGAVLGLAVLAASAQTPDPSVAEAAPDVMDMLTKGVVVLNGQVPMMLDEDTRLDLAVLGPGVGVSYHYTLVNDLAADFDHAVFRAEMRKLLRTDLCAAAEFKPLLDAGATGWFVYRSKDDVEIARIPMTLGECRRVETHLNRKG